MSYLTSRATSRRQRMKDRVNMKSAQKEQGNKDGSQWGSNVGQRRCQNCLTTEHWTFECPQNGSVYQQRKSAAHRFKQFSYVLVPFASFYILSFHIYCARYTFEYPCTKHVCKQKIVLQKYYLHTQKQYQNSFF